jgi:hypothetical protein
MSTQSPIGGGRRKIAARKSLISDAVIAEVGSFRFAMVTSPIYAKIVPPLWKMLPFVIESDAIWQVVVRLSLLPEVSIVRWRGARRSPSSSSAGMSAEAATSARRDQSVTNGHRSASG